MLKNVVLCKNCVYWDGIGYCSITDQEWDPENWCCMGEQKGWDHTDGIGRINIALDKGARLPERAHDADAGMDLFVPVSVGDGLAVFPGGSITIDTGVHVEIPNGYVGLLKSKSGLNVNHGLIGEGVIDAGYTGSIVVKMYNFGSQRYVFRPGDKIIQLLIVRCETPDIVSVSKLKETERGDNGFGSTGR